MNLARLTGAISAWIRGATGVAGVTLVWGEPNAPRATNPFVRLKLSGPDVIGHDELVPDSETEVQKIVFSATPDAGTFKLVYGATATALIAYNASAKTIQAALKVIAGLEQILVIGSIAAGLIVIFEGVVDAPSLLGLTANTLERQGVEVTLANQIDTAGAFRIIGPRALSLSINAYGEDAQQILANIQTTISDPTQMAVLSAVKLSVLDTSPARDLSALLETKFEQRHQMDVQLLTTEEYLVVPGVIEHIEASSVFGGIESEITVDA